MNQTNRNESLSVHSGTYYLTSQEQDDITILLREKGFMKTDDILKTRIDASEGGKIPLLEMFDFSDKEKGLYFILLVTRVSPRTWELSEVSSAYQIPLLANGEGLDQTGKSYHEENGPIPDRVTMEQDIMQQARSLQIEHTLKTDRNILKEFQIMGVSEYQRMLNKRGRHANLTYLRTKRGISKFPRDGVAAIPDTYRYAHFEFVIVFASYVNNPYIALVKASIAGKDLEKQDKRPKIEKVFTRSPVGLPTLQQMTRELTASLEVTPIEIESILRLFKNSTGGGKEEFPKRRRGKEM